MAKRVNITKEELHEHLREQISFLVDSSIAYDAGKSSEAKRIASTLRILLHDTRNSKSLLGQLDAKRFRFPNTCKEYDKEELAPYLPLISFKFNSPKGYRPWIVPSGTPKDWPRKRHLRFSDWWNMTVVKTPKKGKKDVGFCRREIILNVANTDGGSHIDPSLKENYAALSK